MKGLAQRSLPAPPRRVALVVVTLVGLVTTLAAFADLPQGSATVDQVLRGRQLVVDHDCGGCHSQGSSEGVHSETWLAGFLPGKRGEFTLGGFKTRARNLTPDSATGLGRFSTRQIFNALRYGLKPGDTPDMLITSTVRGEGNFPASPRYLAPPMPWPALRHMRDEDLWAIAAYLKHGIKEVSNKVPDSEGPPDFWAENYAPGKIGTFPLPVYPAANETFKP